MGQEDFSSVNAEKDSVNENQNLGNEVLRVKDNLARESEDRAAKYSVGHLRNPRPEDRRFTHRSEAIDAAFAGAKDEDVWAVWFIDSIAMVVYDGESFS